ncbi:unnamed protein product, partial [Effrenium voratum]
RILGDAGSVLGSAGTVLGSRQQNTRRCRPSTRQRRLSTRQPRHSTQQRQQNTRRCRLSTRQRRHSTRQRQPSIHQHRFSILRHRLSTDQQCSIPRAQYQRSTPASLLQPMRSAEIVATFSCLMQCSAESVVRSVRLTCSRRWMQMAMELCRGKSLQQLLADSRGVLDTFKVNIFGASQLVRCPPAK